MPVIQFKAPRTSLGDLETESVATLIAAASDIALVVDGQGTIRDIALNTDDLAAHLDGYDDWIGLQWSDTVTVESRAKIDSLLGEASARAVSGWREVNHPSRSGPDVPIAYSSVQIGPGRTVSIGRDLRPIAELQQRLIEAQHSLERDYSKLRHVEMRYRLLFELSTEPLLVVDATSLKIIDSNPAARHMLGNLGRSAITDLFDGPSFAALQSLFASVRTVGRAPDAMARMAADGSEVRLSASVLRQDGDTLFIVRIAPVQAMNAAAALPQIKARMLEIIENAPDGIVVTSPDGRILSANAAFLDLAQVTSEDQVRGEPLDRWLGRAGVDLDVLLANLRRNGVVRLFVTVFRTEFGGPADVEVSAVSVTSGGQPCFGFTIRNVSRRLVSEVRLPEIPRAVEQLKELIGRVALKDIVRETTDVIERLYIKAALELTGDNRASAAEMLGLSRQSLYVKLRRYGLADLPMADEAEG